MTDSADSQATAGLVTAARAGDHAAFAVLIQRHYPMVHALCTRVLGDAGLAQDATQEATVTAMLGLARLRHDDRFGAWLAGIALNLCRRLLRDRDWAAFSLDALLEDRVISEPAGTGPDPAEAAAAAEVTRRIKDAVSALPPGQRQAAEAYYPHRPHPGRDRRPAAHTGQRGQDPPAQGACRTARQPPRLPARKTRSHER
jgi:RNA polymerase sigma factor (sigma-70 family)